MKPTKEGHFHFRPDSVARVYIESGKLRFATTNGCYGCVDMSSDLSWGPEIPPHHWPPTEGWYPYQDSRGESIVYVAEWGDVRFGSGCHRHIADISGRFGPRLDLKKLMEGSEK